MYKRIAAIALSALALLTVAPTAAQAATVTSGGSAVVVGTVSGTGYLDLTTKKLGGAYNVPTYAIALCDGKVTGSATFNTDSTSNIVHTMAFSGKSCTIKVNTGAMSAGRPKQNISATISNIRKVAGATPVVIRQPWNTRRVVATSDFTVKTPSSSTGLLGLQVTGCTSKAGKSGGGDTDSTITDGCWGYMKPGGSSTVSVQVLSGGKVIASKSQYVSYTRHHENIGIAVPKTAGWITVRVKVTGAPVLVHGPGTSFVGAR